MAGEDHERRISTVEANLGNMNYSLQKIEGYLGKLFDQNGEIKTGLALVVSNQVDMKIYQKDCDTEREDHEKRITSCEGFQSRLIKMGIAVTGIGSLISPQLSKLWERFFA